MAMWKWYNEKPKTAAFNMICKNRIDNKSAPEVDQWDRAIIYVNHDMRVVQDE